jgi:hypothetical protein
MACVARGNARTPRAGGVVTTCGGALTGASVGASWRQGVAGEHRWGSGVAPHRQSGGGAHPSGGSTWGGRSVGEERALVSGRAVLRLEVEVREVAVARRRSREGKIVGRGRKFGRRRLNFKGSDGEGPRRGGHRVEAERERGGPGAVAWRRCHSGPTVALAGGALPRDSLERRGRRDAGRRGWQGAEARRGPGRQRLGAARGSAVRRRRGADRWGRQHSAPDSVFKLNQNESNLFQTDSNLPQTLTDLKGAFPCSKNFK